MSKPKFFLSAVSGQFRDCRNALASDLRAIGVEVVVQEDFRQHGWTLLEKLRDYIAGCDRVIALVGDAYGFEPSEETRPHDQPRRSYSQWEYHFALGERLDEGMAARKPVYVYVATGRYLTEHPVNQKPECAALQNQFVAAIHDNNKDHQSFGSLDELRWKNLRDVVRVEEPGSLPGVTACPVVVIGLSRRGDAHVFRAAIRWWRGRHIEICKPQDLALNDRRRLAERVEFALEFATKVFCEGTPILPLVVELVLSEDLLVEAHAPWKDRWTVACLSARPDVRRLLHEFWPVRLRVAKHWDSGSIAQKLGERLTSLKECPEELSGVLEDLDDLDDNFKGPRVMRIWAVIQDETSPSLGWWRDESVVCAAFTKRPRLVRKVVTRGAKQQPAAKPTPFLNAIDFGVPFIVWPNKQEADKQKVAGFLNKCRRPSDLCRYFHRLDPEAFCVLDESCESPWPIDLRMIADVMTDPGESP